MKMMTRKYPPITAAMLALALACFAFAQLSTVAAAAPDTLTLSMTFPPSMMGRGSASVWDDIIRLQAILKKEYGIDLRIKKEVSWDKVISLLEKGEADIAPLPPYYYASAIQRKPDLTLSPLAAFESAGSPSSRHCIYMLPGKNGLPEHDEPLDLLVGARVAFPDEAEWVVLNLIFRDSIYKFDASTYMYFFQSFKILNRESAALAMLFGELDAVVMDEVGMKYVMEMDNRLEKVIPIQCTGALPGTMIAARSGMPEPLKRKVLKILAGMHENPDFAPFRNFFRVSGGRWVSATGIDYTPWKEIVNISKGKGWDRVFSTMPMQ